MCLVATSLITITLCAPRAHCDLALKQKVIVYTQKGTETEQGKDLIIVKYMFDIGRMNTILDFFAKQHHVLYKTEGRKVPIVDEVLLH